MLVHPLIKAFVRQSGTLAASRPSDNSLAPGAQPPLACFACNGSNLSLQGYVGSPRYPGHCPVLLLACSSI